MQIDDFLNGKFIAECQFIEPNLLKFSPHHSFEAPKAEIEYVNIEQLTISVPHMLIFNDHIEKRELSTIKYKSDSENPRITTVNMDPRFFVLEFIRHCPNISRYAEIGVKYGATATAVQEFLPNIPIDLYEKSEIHCSYLNSLFADKPLVSVIEGYAQHTLKNNNECYDLVYFDASHQYEVDKRILDALIPHLTKDSVVIFDDYELDDVKRLIKEFLSTNTCKCKIIAI